MRVISHRGNLNGSNPGLENHPDYVLFAISRGFDAEVDLWLWNNELYLGHNKPDFKINPKYLLNPWIWIHCKNIEAAEYVTGKSLNIFFHQTDDISITSNGYLWTYPGKLITSKSIAVLPETVPDWNIKGAYGVCTDYPLNYK